MKLESLSKPGALIAVLIFSTGLAASQPSGDAIVVSGVDEGLISKSVSDKINSPILNVNGDYVPKSTSKAITRMSSPQVIVVGREGTISNEVKAELQRKSGSVKVVEGSDIEDTALTVSRTFWPEGSQQVTIVQDISDVDKAASIRNNIDSRSGPVLVSESNSINSEIISEIKRLDPEKVTVYSVDSKNVGTSLEELGSENVRVIERNGDNDGFKIGDRVEELLVNPTDSEEGIKAISSGSHSKGFVIGSREEIAALVDASRDSKAEKVVIAGDSMLARATVSAFRTRTDLKIEKEYTSSSATVEVAFEG